MRRQPIHTTLSVDAFKVLERYEHELGAKNLVLEKALFNLDKRRYNTRLDASRLERHISRVSTGMPGFDKVIEGGIPKGFVVTVTGPPGTGKTTFSMQFLLDGAKNNEKCIFCNGQPDGVHISLLSYSSGDSPSNP